MNDDDFAGMFSMQGAYRDDDGIDIGSNDVSGELPQPRFQQPSAAPLTKVDLLALWTALIIGLTIAVTIAAVSFF